MGRIDDDHFPVWLETDLSEQLLAPVVEEESVGFSGLFHVVDPFGVEVSGF